MQHVVQRLWVTAIVVSLLLACRDADPVRPFSTGPTAGPAPSGPRWATSTTGVTVIDLASGAEAFAINEAGVVAGEWGGYIASWSGDGVVRTAHAPCVVCCMPNSPYPPGCRNFCDDYCTLNPAHDWPAAALGINDAGEITGYYHVYITHPSGSFYHDYQNAFRWPPGGGVADIGWLGTTSRESVGSEVTARAINGRGDVVGRSPAPPNWMAHPFVRSSSGAIRDLIVIPPGSSDTWGDALAINERGDVVGYDYTNGEHAWLWRADGSQVDLGTLGGWLSSRAYAVNDSGMVGGTGSGGGFVWTESGGFRAVPLMPLGINNRGYVAGQRTTSASTVAAAVLEPDGSLIELGTLGGASSVAYAINDSLQVAGRAQDAAGVWHAVRWDVAVPAAPRIVVALYDTTPASIEGMDVVVQGSATGDAMLQPVWTFDDGTRAYTWSVFRRYADNGTHTATLTVTGLSGATASATATITINNAPPEPTVTVSSPGRSGSSATLDALVRDRGVNDAPWSWRIDWGDGRDTTGSLTSLASHLVVESSPYCAPGTYTVRLTVTDKDGGVGTGSMGVRIDPVVASIEPRRESIGLRPGGTFSVAVLGSVTLNATHIDPLSVTLDVGGVSLGAAVRGSGRPFATLTDVNRDGVTDLVLRFERRPLDDAGLADGSVPVALTARLDDGCTAVAGSTTVRVTAR